jgi:CRP-like cAMP-binding protein/Fe-S-cluster-containing hydrogenase component 2
MEAPEKLTTGEPLSIEEMLKHLPALGEISQGLLKNYALGAAVLRRFSEGDIVCEEGEFGSTAFYIVEGDVDIYIENPLAKVQSARGGKGIFGFFKKITGLFGSRDESSAEQHGYIAIDADVDLPKTKPLATLGAGDLFGEMTCRTFQPRSATVRAKGDCVMIEMLRVVLDMLLGTRDVDADTKASTKVKAPTFKGTSFKKAMDEKYRARSLSNHLSSVPLFATLGDEFLGYLRDRAELVSCGKGQVICKQGDPADAFYLIRSGLVKVSQAMPGGEMVRTYLKRGEFFGEIGFLKEQPRNATCTALDAVDLVKINATDFRVMLEKFPIVRESLMKIAEARLAADAERRPPPGLQLDDFLNQGLYEAQNLLLIDLDHCTRCDACVNACADAHDGVTRLIRDGLRYDHFMVPTACRSCRDPLCMTQCPVGSIRRKESLEIIIEDWCIGCTKCAELCPYGNINMHPFEVTKEVPAEAPKPATPAAAAAAAKPAVAANAAAPSVKPAASVAKPAEPSVKPAEPPVKLAEPPVKLAEPPVKLAEPPVKLAEPSVKPAEPSVKPAEPSVKPAEPSVKSAVSKEKPAVPPEKPAPKKEEPAKKMVKKKVSVQKATTCDLCTDLSVPSCVYACPHDAAKRVDPARFFTAEDQDSGWSFQKKSRTTH